MIYSLVEPIAGEVIDGKCICDIQVISVYPYKALKQFTEYMILGLFCENGNYCLRVVWWIKMRRLCVLMATKFIDGQEHSPSIFYHLI